MITGANSGVGFEVAQFLVSRGATVFMVCRSAGRAEEAAKRILESTGAQEERVVVLLCDCSLEADVRRTWQEFASRSDRLDGLVCNAGALLNEKTLTTEGVEDKACPCPCMALPLRAFCGSTANLCMDWPS